jgi:hypothetical protein
MKADHLTFQFICMQLASEDYGVQTDCSDLE